MSILLDALKKSEAQRRLGATPTLDSPIQSTRVSGNGGPRWVPVALVALAAAAMTWFGWNGAPEPHSADSAVSLTATEPAPSGVERNPAPVPRSRARPAAAEPDDRTPDETDSVERKRRLLGTTFESFKAPPEDEEASGASSEPGAEAASRDTAERTPTQAPEAASSRTEATSDILAEEAAAGLSRAAPRDEPAEDTISYWQLPGSARSSMPELRIRVLVYAEQPENRFLLINDLRLREGEEVESGLRLEEIRRDRAVFSYRNYRFHLKG